MPVAVAAVDVVAVAVLVAAVRALVGVVVVVRARVQVLVHVGVLVGVGMAVRMGMHHVAVAVLVGMGVGVRMGVTMLVRVLVRRGMVVTVGDGLVVHEGLPGERRRRERSQCAPPSGPNTLRITASPASTVILT